MTKKSRAKKKSSSRKSADHQVAEFERRDLGRDIRKAGTAKVVRPRGKPTSIVLNEDLVRRLRAKGAKRGLGYQTMLKMIVLEHLDEY